MPDHAAEQNAAMITTDYVRGASVVRCVGEIDMSTAPMLREAIERLLSHRPPILVIDLTGVRFLGSAGIAALIAAHESAQRADIILAVAASSRAELRSLEVSTVDQVLTLFPTVGQAVDGTAPTPPTAP